MVGALTSHGFLEDDAWAHFLYSRSVWNSPAYLADVWGRPVCTGVYALGAWSMFGARVVSLLLVLAAAELTRRTAKALSIDEFPAVAFLLAMPVLYLHSLSVMTELPFAVLLIGAFLAYLKQRWWLLALLVGVLPLARPEGFGFILLAAIPLLWRRRLLELPLLVLPLIGWSWYGWTFARAAGDRSPWLWLIDHWPYSATSTYGSGSVFQFVVLMPILVGIGLPFILIGVRRERSLVAAIPLLMLVVHSLLWAFGKMASYGEIRYLLIAGPFWALLAAIGWQACRVKPSPFVLAVISLTVLAGLKAFVVPQSKEGRIAVTVAEWAKDHPRVVATHPAINVLLNRPKWESLTPDILFKSSSDVVLIWDPKTGPQNADERLAVKPIHLSEEKWEVVKEFEGGWMALRRRD